MPLYKTLPYRLILLFLFFILVIDAPLAQPPDPVKSRLDALSIDTTITPRTIPKPNNPSATVTLTDRYAPLGNTYTVNKITELGLLNIGLQSSPQVKFSLHEDLAKVTAGGNPVLISSDPVSQHAPIANYERRYGTHGDLDGDGIEEILLLYQVLDPNDSIRKLHLQVLRRNENGTFASALLQSLYVESSTPLATPANATRKIEIEEVAFGLGNIDFNNANGAIDDNKNELIVAICCETDYTQANVPFGRRVDVRAYKINQPNLGSNVLVKTEVTGYQRYIQNQLVSKLVYPKLAIGSLDADVGSEVALLLNERTEDPSNNVSSDGITRYFIIDDIATNYGVINTGNVQGTPIGSSTKSAIIADVAIGDVDADGYDEVLFGGLTGFTTNCGTSVEHILVTIDDALNDFANQPVNAGLAIVPPPGGCGGSGSGGEWYHRAIHIDTLDVNGDKVPEVQVNGMIFNGWLTGVPWTKIYDSNVNTFVGEGQFRFLPTNSAMAVGDYNGDSNQDLIYYSGPGNQIRVIGIKKGMTTFSLLDSKDIDTNSSDYESRPTILMPDVDTDATILRYLNHQLIFSEPIIVAVMAAPPCNPNWGQNSDLCRTSFGVSTSQGDTIEKSVSMEASVTIGVALADPLDLFNVSASGSIGKLLNETRTTSYTRTYTKTFITGPLEDAVVFTSIPIDRYTYVLVSCNSEVNPVVQCEPDQVDEYVFNVDLPREPRTLKTKVNTYNALVPADKAIRIDSNILSHVAGDPSSYKTTAEKDDLVNPPGVTNPCCESEISSTGNSGPTEVQIEIGIEESTANSYEINYGFDFEATAGGVLTGFSVGFAEGESLQMSIGQSTIFTGTVDDHDVPNWLDYSFDWGLFSYVRQAEVPGVNGDRRFQQFQVLDYWTVPPFEGWPPTPTPDPNATPTTGPEPTVQGPPPGSAELLVNNSVEVDDNGNKQPDKWKGKNLGTGDKLKCNKPEKSKILAHSGRCAFAFKGIGTKAKLEQSIKQDALVPYTLIGGDVMRAAIYASGKSIPADAAVFKIKVKYTDPAAGVNGDGKDKLKLQITLAAEGVYQLFEQTLLLATAPSDIKTQIQFKAPSGKLYVDDMSISVPTGTGLQLIPLP
jgi:hypothetical protein